MSSGARSVKGSSAGQAYVKELGKGHEIDRSNLIGTEPQEIFEEFLQWNNQHAPNPDKLKNQLMSLYYAPDIESAQSLSDEEWNKLGTEFLEALTEHKADHLCYYIEKHDRAGEKDRIIDRPHLHIYVARATEDGKLIKDFRSESRAHRIDSEMAQKYGFQDAIQIGKDNKEYIKQSLLEAQKSSKSWNEYKSVANKKGIQIELITKKNGDIQGYKVSLKTSAQHLGDGIDNKRAISYKVSDIDRGLTIPKLELSFSRNKERAKQELQEKLRLTKLEKQQNKGQDRGWSPSL